MLIAALHLSPIQTYSRMKSLSHKHYKKSQSNLTQSKCRPTQQHYRHRSYFPPSLCSHSQGFHLQCDSKSRLFPKQPPNYSLPSRNFKTSALLQEYLEEELKNVQTKGQPPLLSIPGLVIPTAIDAKTPLTDLPGITHPDPNSYVSHDIPDDSPRPELKLELQFQLTPTPKPTRVRVRERVKTSPSPVLYQDLSPVIVVPTDKVLNIPNSDSRGGRNNV